MVSDEVMSRFTPPIANEDTPLQVTIHSFSYKKGIPEDPSENGGGFVFDMRGILNPGRFDEYKKTIWIRQACARFPRTKNKDECLFK